MKNLIFLIFSIVVFVKNEDLGRPHMMNIGHRGTGVEAPENTMAAFRKSIEAGAQGFETDLRLSKDGVIVLSHEERLEKRSNCKGYVRDHTLEELKKCDFGSWFSPEFAGEQIPTFKEALTLAKENNVFIVLDLKEDGLGEKIAELVIPMDMESNVVASCRNRNQVLDINRNLNSTVRQMLGTQPKKFGDDYFREMLMYKVSSFSFRAEKTHTTSELTADFIKQAHTYGMIVYVWTVDKEEDFWKMEKIGVDGIITDNPRLLNKVLLDIQTKLFSEPIDFQLSEKENDDDKYKSRPLIVAHRGNSAHDPENTLTAFTSAKKNHADGFETDLRFTSDGVMVLSHDPTLDRMTNCTGKIADLPYEYVSQCIVGGVEKVPTFEEAVVLAKELDMFIVMDIYLDGLAKEVARIAKKYKMETKLIASCRTFARVDEFQYYLPLAPKQFLALPPAQYDETYWKKLKERNVRSLNYEFDDNLTAQFIEDAHKHQISVISWVSNTKEQYFKGYKDAHDIIMTNDPLLEYQVIKKIRERAFP